MPTDMVHRPRRWLRPLIRVLLCAALAYSVSCTTLVLLQDQMIFPGAGEPMPMSDPPSRPGVVVSKLAIATGGEVEAWFLPAPGVTAQQPGPAVIFCHGNAELIDHQDYYVNRYHALGVSVLLPEYRGYGRSAGQPSQKGIGEDMVRFYDQLLERPEVDRTKIVYHGHSLGGAVACDLASRRLPRALILHSTLVNMKAFAHRYLVPGFLVRHPFRNDEVVAGLDIPVLIFHGGRDEVIPVEHGRRLAALARNGKYVEYDCGHNDWPGKGNESDFWTRIGEFLLEAKVLDRPASGNLSTQARRLFAVEEQSCHSQAKSPSV